MRSSSFQRYAGLHTFIHLFMITEQSQSDPLNVKSQEQNVIRLVLPPFRKNVLDQAFFTDCQSLTRFLLFRLVDLLYVGRTSGKDTHTVGNNFINFEAQGIPNRSCNWGIS